LSNSACERALARKYTASRMFVLPAMLGPTSTLTPGLGLKVRRLMLLKFSMVISSGNTFIAALSSAIGYALVDAAL